MYKENLNSSKFDERCKLGDLGEQVVRDFFEENNYKYEDVTKDAKYQIIDVDFLVDINDKEYKMETKTFEKSIADYNNIMVKAHTKYLNPRMAQKKGNDAWLEKSKADFIIFVCAKTKKIIIVNFCKLKQYIEEYKNTDYIQEGRYLDVDKQHNGLYTRRNTVYYLNITHLEQTLNKDNRSFVKIYN